MTDSKPDALIASAPDLRAVLDRVRALESALRRHRDSMIASRPSLTPVQQEALDIVVADIERALASASEPTPCPECAKRNDVWRRIDALAARVDASTQGAPEPTSDRDEKEPASWRWFSADQDGHVMDDAELAHQLEADYLTADFIADARVWGKFWREHAAAPRGPTADRIAELERLATIIDSPQMSDFLAAVTNEAAHQVKRWGTEHDAGKAPEDWFWLLAYLAGKALHAAKAGDREKALHHTISSAAALFNWHRAMSGIDTSMRPGIEPPDGLTPRDPSASPEPTEEP